MSEVVFEAQELTKRYKTTTAVDHASFTIEKGHVYGFIGENGAGKTTIIRLIAGLITPTSGSYSVFGLSGAANLDKARSRMGFMIESPTIYPSFTGRENISIQMKMFGIDNPDLPDALLTKVGLDPNDKKKAKNYSLGMRQRLGIAMTLVNDPEFLVLDEPINGLDPLGIIDIRNIIEEQKNLGKTVLISSHILSELYQLATDYVIISHGQIVDKVSLEELEDKCTSHHIIRTPVPDKALAIAQSFGLTKCSIEDGVLHIKEAFNVEELMAKFMQSQVIVTELSNHSSSLEDYYVSKIGGAARE